MTSAIASLISSIKAPFDAYSRAYGARLSAAATCQGHHSYADYLHAALVGQGSESAEMQTDISMIARDITHRTNIESFKQPTVVSFMRKSGQHVAVARLLQTL